MSKVLYLDEERQHTLSAGAKQLMRLIPGRNVVDDDLFDAVLNSGIDGKPSQLKVMIDERKIVVKADTVDISKKKVPEAIELAELEVTEEGLQDLLSQENTRKDPRKTVMNAINDRLEAIQNPTDSSDQD